MNIFPIVFKRTMEMLTDRHYIISKKVSLAKSVEDIKNLLDKNNQHCAIFVKKKIQEISPKYKKVLVFFSIEKFGIKELRIKVKEILQLKIDHVIFILQNKFTSHGQRLLNKYTKLEAEIFYFSEMMINPIHHELVPKHQLLTKEETKQFYQRIGKKIPCIKVSDRICRHYNGKIGQIFRIYRQNELYYRIVAY